MRKAWEIVEIGEIFQERVYFDDNPVLAEAMMTDEQFAEIVYKYALAGIHVGQC